jgi:diguanylate cyclase (GGDEF)-like protein
MEQIQPTAFAIECQYERTDAPGLVAQELKTENEHLQKQLAHVLATATANEAIWRHFAEIERILFRTRELDQLVEELLREIKIRFQPDQLALLLCHPELLERFFPDISEESEPIGENTWILSVSMEAGCGICGDPARPLLFSSQNITKLRELLPQLPASMRSGVLIPLCVHQILFGGLFLGSVDANHYRPQDGTELLEQLGIKIALCMDNCLAYEKVKDFAIQDPLTGLLNFFQIRTILEREFRKACRLGSPLSILMIKLDFHHQSEDRSELAHEILKHGAGLLREILHDGDSVLGRYGSDEFLVLLPNIQEEEAREVVPYLKQTILKSPFRHQNAAILIRATIGVGTLEDGMKRPQDLLDGAYLDLCSLKMSHSEPT